MQESFPIKRTFDVHLVNAIANDPAVRVGAGWTPDMGDIDFAAAVADERAIFLAVPHGCFMLLPTERGYEGHTMLLPSARPYSTAAARAAADWVFLNTDAGEITTYAPTNNPAAAWLARKTGFVETARDPEAWEADGQRWDVQRFVLTRERWKEGKH